MAREYLNKRQKEVYINFDVFADYLQLLLEENSECIRPYRTRIKTMVSYIKTITNGLEEHLDESHRRFLHNQTHNCRLIVVPREDMRLKKTLTVIETKVLQEFASSAFNQCFLCEKEKQDARDCQLRRTLLEVGAVVKDNGKGVCPFKQGL